MESPKKVIRKSIFLFLQNYQYFTKVPILLIFPFSSSILLSQTLFSSSSSSSPFLSFLNLETYPFYQILNSDVSMNTITYVFILFLAHSTLLLANGLIIQTIIHQKLSLSIPLSSFKSLLITQLCNFILVIFLNTISISLLHIIFPPGSLPKAPLFWAFSIGVYYSFFTTAKTVCNLALVVSEVEKNSRFLAIFKGFSLSLSANCLILSVNLPIHLGMFAVEALFGYRIVKTYLEKGFFEPCMVIEVILIAYVYSIIIVIDTVASCVFFKSCKANDHTDCEERYRYRIVIEEENDCKIFENIEISVLVQ